MAWHDMTANFVDAVWSGLRKFKQTSNSDGTISLEDKTVYTTSGSQVGATEFNAIADDLNYLKSMPIRDLTAITDIPNASMLAVDNGSVTNYITASNLLKQQTMITFPNTQLLTTTVDALTLGRAYTFVVAAGNQTASGLPTNRTFVGTAYCYTADAKIIIIHAVSANEEWYTRKGTSGWDIWRLRSGNLTGTVTRGSMMGTDTIDLTAAGSTGILRIASRIATAGTYGNTDYLLTTSIKPSKTSTGICMLGSTAKIVNINSGGNVFFNNDTAVTANQYLIGTIVFPIASWL